MSPERPAASSVAIKARRAKYNSGLRPKPSYAKFTRGAYKSYSGDGETTATNNARVECIPRPDVALSALRGFDQTGTNARRA